MYDACIVTLDEGVELELMSDPDMINLFESSLRGGVSYVTERHVETDEKTNTNLIYVDVNNLYGKAQTYPMPTGDFKWEDIGEFEDYDWAAADLDGETGYALVVDLEYPEHLHADHDSYPLAPMPETITAADLSPYARQCLSTVGGLTERKIDRHCETKLCATLRDREEYFVHFASLKTYLQLGMKLKGVSRIVSFKQATVLKKYIEGTAAKRAAAFTAFEKEIWKLANNALYGLGECDIYIYIYICVGVNLS